MRSRVIGQESALSYDLYHIWLHQNWILSIWHVVISLKVVLNIENQWVPPEQDRLLMDCALQFDLAPKVLRDIN
jgi:hypothetical protein